MFTKEQLKMQLTNLGVPTNVPVIVHTSLKAVGETEGRAEGLLEVLIEHCTKDGGLLCIPTHTWSYAREEGRIAFDLTKKESCVGALTVVALNHPKAVRSMHPTHSMVVFGDEEKVKEFVKGEEKFNTPTAPDSCYGKIYKQNGYVLLLGVGHERNTFIHCVDEMLCVPNRLTDETKTVKVRLNGGEVITREMYTHFAKGIGTSISAKFPKFSKAFEYTGATKEGKIGNATAILCSAVKIKETLEKIKNRTNGIELLDDAVEIKEEYYK